jgi:predicted nucleotidyltransferase component of viral defense system
MSTPGYDNPQALRQALADRLRPLAGASGMELSALLRQFAYDRLLCRVFSADPERWVLKGATAMLARLEGRARHTLDVDLYRRDGSLADAERALREAAAVDLGDYFRFTLGAAKRMAQGADALRIPAVAFLGATEFARFHVDLVADLSMTGAAEEFPPLILVELPGVRHVAYRVYPIADHIADKICAMFERHPRADGRTEQSTRYRDLVDLVTFAHTATVGAVELRRAIDSEAKRRQLTLPGRLEVPSSSGWAAGYARIAGDTPALEERDLTSALSSARRLVDPVLAGTADGWWDPATMAWGTP